MATLEQGGAILLAVSADPGLLAVAAKALVRARVVATLDGWAERRGYPCQIELSADNEGATVSRWRIALRERGAPWRYFYGPTPDAARALAALAIEAGEA